MGDEGQEKVNVRIKKFLLKATWREGSGRHKAGRENLLPVRYS